MYIDAQHEYSVAQALAGPGTVTSTNAIDFSSDRNMGVGEPLVAEVTVGVAAAGGGTLTVSLQTDSTSAFGSPVQAASTGPMPAAALVAGYRFGLLIPPDLQMNRWSRLSYVLATMTGITVTSFLIPAKWIQDDLYYPAGYTIQ